MANFSKFTQKSMEALEGAQSLALKEKNQQLEEVHLLSAMLAQSDGLTGELLRAAKLDPALLSGALDIAISRLA